MARYRTSVRTPISAEKAFDQLADFVVDRVVLVVADELVDGSVEGG